MPSIDKYPGSISTKNALKALIYTMLRTVEVRRGLKEYIDFEARTWTIPIASKSDILAGKRNMKKKPHSYRSTVGSGDGYPEGAICRLSR